MSGMWASTPTTIRLEDLDAICAVLDCTPSDLLIPEPEKVAAAARAAAEVAEQAAKATASGGTNLPVIRPRLGRNRTLPPA